MALVKVVTGHGLEVEIASDTRFHTVYTNDGKPAGTIILRSVHEKSEPVWTAYALNGKRVGAHSLNLFKSMLGEIAKANAV